MLQMGATALEANLQRHAKLLIIQVHFSFLDFPDFCCSAFSLNIGELKALNTAKF